MRKIEDEELYEDRIVREVDFDMEESAFGYGYFPNRLSSQHQKSPVSQNANGQPDGLELRVTNEVI